MSNKAKYRVLPERKNGLICIVDAESGKIIKRVKSVTGASKWLIEKSLQQ